MVYQGPSKACARCKQRHIKCDETRPTCRNCQKRQLPCPGYAPEPGIRFQDETTSTIHQAQQRERRPVRRKSGKHPVSVPKSLPEDTEAVALNFFFENYAKLGRGSQSSHGLFETIIPIYSSAAASSAMAAATSAVALTLTSEWHGRIDEAPLARRHLGKALSLLRASLNDPVLSLKDETMMAVLLLKFHDMLVATKNLKEVPEDHVNGAIALIKHRGLASFDTDTSKRLLQYVRHTAISSAIQRRTKLNTDSDLWIDPEAMLKTPCVDLDWIGVEIANLRASTEVRRILHYHPSITTLDEKQRKDVVYVRDQAAKLEIRLSLWSDRLSGRWRPEPIANIQDVDETIRNTGFYAVTCDFYPSAQITNVWNLYRSYCLLILELLLRCEVLLEQKPGKGHTSNYDTLFQTMVDDLCASVPFLLGNRTEPGSMEDFDLPNDIRFLRHSSSSNHEASDLEMDMYMSAEQRTKSLVAQGPWQLYEHLGQIVRYMASDIAEARDPLLRPGQVEWMQEQMRRVLIIQRIEGKGRANELRNKRTHTSIQIGACDRVDPIPVGSADTTVHKPASSSAVAAKPGTKRRRDELDEGV